MKDIEGDCTGVIEAKILFYGEVWGSFRKILKFSTIK